MQIVQIFLPLYDNHKQIFARSVYDELRNELKELFGGVTFYRNSAVEGIWKDDDGKTNYDELVIAEVMIETADKKWWTHFKQKLEQVFKQEEILIRFVLFEKL